MNTYTINGVTLTLTQGNIVEARVDAIVNAANAALAGGGGVDGAIHRAAGPSLMQECRKIGGCPTGSAVATPAGNLPAKYVFHAVGPIYRDRKTSTPLLEKAYKSCLELAEQYQVKSIAFPSLSTGAYGYPLSEAANIAMRTMVEYMGKGETEVREIIFVLFGEKALRVFEEALEKNR